MNDTSDRPHTTTDRPPTTGDRRETATDRPPHGWDLRIPTADEVRSYMVPVQLAFAEEFSGPEVEDWLKLVEPERWLGAFEDERSDVVLGVASAHSLRLTVPGGDVAAAAVTGVGVRPDHRRRGILRALMERQLADVRARGEPVAVLWASEGSIYQRFGYGMAAADGFIDVATARTAFAFRRPPEGRVRIVSEEEAATLVPRVYETMRARTPGALSRSEAWWDAVLADPEYSRRGQSPKFRVVYEVDGAPEAYAVYRIKDDWDHLGPRKVLEVKESVSLTPSALRGLWRYLFDVDLVRSVRVHRAPVPNPLQHILAEPRALGLTVADGLWLRLVDLPAALAARRYAMSGSLVLEVHDDGLPDNAGRWRLRVEGQPGAGEAAVERTTDDADLALDSADLAAVYLGGSRPSELAAVGRIEELTAGSLDVADRLFAADRAPWCVMMF